MINENTSCINVVRIRIGLTMFQLNRYYWRTVSCFFCFQSLRIQATCKPWAIHGLCSRVQYNNRTANSRVIYEALVTFTSRCVGGVAKYVWPFANKIFGNPPASQINVYHSHLSTTDVSNSSHCFSLSYEYTSFCSCSPKSVNLFVVSLNKDDWPDCKFVWKGNHVSRNNDCLVSH